MQTLDIEIYALAATLFAAILAGVHIIVREPRRK